MSCTGTSRNTGVLAHMSIRWLGVDGPRTEENRWVNSRPAFAKSAYQRAMAGGTAARQNGPPWPFNARAWLLQQARPKPAA